MPPALWVFDHSSSLPGVALLGLGVGYVAGMFGVGGGFILVPLLHLVFGVPLPVAVGTSLCQMVGTAAVALLRHQKLRQGELRIDLLMIPGSLLGVEAGARTLTALSHAGAVRFGNASLPAANLAVDGLYFVGLLTLAYVYWHHGGGASDVLASVRPRAPWRFAPPPRVDLPAVPLRDVSAPVVAYLGLATGFVSGILGLGGGMALMPVLIYGYGFSFRQAAGTGILMLVATSSVGTFAHAVRGNVDLVLAMAILMGSSISAQFGAMATKRLPARTLSRVLAVVTLAASAAVAWDLLRRVA